MNALVFTDELQPEVRNVNNHNKPFNFVINNNGLLRKRPIGRGGGTQRSDAGHCSATEIP